MAETWIESVEIRPDEPSPGGEMTARVEVAYDSGVDTLDICTYSLTRSGANSEVVLRIDGTEVAATTMCVPNYVFSTGYETRTLEFDAPQESGEYEFGVELYGTHSGDYYDEQIETVQIGSEPATHEYDLALSAPGAVDQNEPFPVEASVQVVNADAPLETWSLHVADEWIDGGTDQLNEGEGIDVSVPESEMSISEAGTHEIVFAIGGTSERQEIEVREVENPPYDPLDNGDGDNGNGDDSGSEIPWGVVALGGILVAASAADDDSTEVSR